MNREKNFHVFRQQHQKKRKRQQYRQQQQNRHFKLIKVLAHLWAFHPTVNISYLLKYTTVCNEKESDSVQATMRSQAIERVRDKMWLYSLAPEVPKYQSSKSLPLV